MNDLKVLDLGCGKNKIKGAIGIDIVYSSDADIIHDLNIFPYPLESDYFDIIYCRDVLEHLDNIVKTMSELHRVAKPNAKVIITTPYFAHPDSFRDPTHKWHFTSESFNFFIDAANPQYLPDKKFKLLKRYFLFSKNYSIAKFICKLFHRKKYERYFSRIFPVSGLYFELEVIK